MASTKPQQLNATDPRLEASKKASVRACPVCSATTCEVLHSQRFVLPEGHPLSDGYDVVYCVQCGFVFADTAVRQRDYDTFYSRFSKYEDGKTSTGGGDSSEDARRLQDTAACIADFLPDRQARILDIGCANGGLLKALHDLGYSRLCGMDPSPACVAAACRLGGVEGVVGSLSVFPANVGVFDAVILSHVMEHVQDLGEAVENLRRLTQDQGVAYVEVPDASRYAECLVSPFQDFNTEHINHFSARSLHSLFARRGWIQKIGGGKTLQAGPEMPYPAVYGFFAKSGSSAIGYGPEEDTNLRDRIEAYIADSRRMMDEIEGRIRCTLAQAPEVIVWGTGQLAMKLLAETCLGQAKIVAFVDGNPVNQGRLLRGHPVLAPEQVKGLPQPIIVTSVIHRREIARSIRDQLKLANPVILLRS